MTLLATCDPIAFVSTADPARARDFYANVLGLRLVSDDPFALVFNAHGTMLRVTKVDVVQPAPYTLLGWRVPDIFLAVAELSACGVAFEKFDSLTQDATGVWASPSGAKIAWFKDPDGNTLSLAELDGTED
jgi:catechol 2,3-dioxygenase-like lactoylglutathione lyase family enzyme